MVIDLKLSRFENAPWGFRLIGGADFEVPLTVVKVTEGSLAEQAGMRVGDVIVRINEESASNMTHNDAHNVISKCGNNFFLGVLREDEINEVEENGHISREELDEASMVVTQVESHAAETFEEIKEATCVTVSSEVHTETSECHEKKVTEEVIAEMMSGEAEVLKDHNVIGVNFNRIFPKAGICQSSEVFRQLNEDAIKTKMEIEKEKRKWTTFLQKPERPIPKSKREQEEQQRAQPYKVRIIKQSKPRIAPDRTPTPPPTPEPEPIKEYIPECIKEEATKEEELLEPPADSEVPNLELVAKTDEKLDQEETAVKTVEASNLNEAAVESNETENIEEKIEDSTDAVGGKIQKTEEELLLEKQLEDVQKQLLALSSLPSTIQATLDAVTKQLADLLPTFKLEPERNTPLTPVQDRVPTPLPEHSGHKSPESSLEEGIGEEEKNLDEIDASEEVKEIVSANITTDFATEHDQMRPPSPIPEEMEQLRLEEEQRKIQEELQYKKQKDQREQLKEELQQRLIQDRRPRRPSRAFGPLTPQERPLVLPGGRRWRKPKDAYNDEFIAEVLSSQAELIVGTTLGVNFLKYQKPEKKIDLEKSEVYKVIHHMERQPRRGIEARPPKVLAEEDVRSRATPMSCG